LSTIIYSSEAQNAKDKRNAEDTEITEGHREEIF
jgi:hypothetical protein